jgi:hypothetical protein
VDGVCAECWGSKGGRKMGWVKQQPGYRSGEGGWWLGALIPNPGCLPWWLLGMAAIAAAVAWVLL